MTALLTDNLPLMAGAPNGIKKLRELILELAVRGKLVPQDPSDEPASELLKRIAVEKERLSPKFKKSSETSVCAGAFELPESWCWASFGDIAQHNSGKTLDKGRNSGVPRDYITTSNLYWGRFELSGVRQMLIEEKDLARCTAIMNDLLICEGGEAGRAAVWDQEREICFQNHVHRARFFGGINPHYAQRCFERLNYSGEIAEYRKGVGISNMSSKSLASIPVPLPPLAEQHRIVAKVDELMALCDRLEAQQADAESAHAQLVQALLDSLPQASDATDFAANWQRLAEHFHTLLTTEPSIDALKQTLLQLAVMGKLVPQDPSDEPASELLKRIAEEKAQLMAEGKLKKQRSLADIEDDEVLFELPDGWAWARFGNICAIKGELVRPEDFPSLRQVAPDCIEKGTGRLTDNRTVKDSGVKGPNSRFFAGQIVYSKIRPSLSKAVLVDFDGLCSADMYPIDAFISSEFLLKEILSEVFLEQVRVAENRIKMPKLNQESLTTFVLPIPPLAEQQRIVAKVDQLMALCDQLKNRLTQARQLNEQLASTLVEQAVA